MAVACSRASQVQVNHGSKSRMGLHKPPEEILFPPTFNLHRSKMWTIDFKMDGICRCHV